jgi:hypothetical protein
MVQKPKQKLPRSKRGPKEERLVIADPQAAIDRLLKPQPEKKT